MDAIVTVRFFKVAEPGQDRTDLPAALRALESVRLVGDRERHLGNGVIFRLERCTEDGDFLDGEFCRKQTGNIPPHTSSGGSVPITLPEGEGIAHLAAFKYHLPTRILLFQMNRQCGSTTRVSDYLYAADRNVSASFEPIFTEDAWDRVEGKTIKSFRVRFASPVDLMSFDDEAVSGVRNAHAIANVYDGPEVEIAVSVGRRRKRRLNTARVLGLFQWIKREEVDVSTMEVVAAGETGSEPIDFIDEHLRASRELDLPERNPNAHYRVRKRFLDEIFSDKMNYILRRFGAGQRARAHR
jgi:hypothetical protein